MATVQLRVTAPHSPYRDCDIAILEPTNPTEPPKAMCTDAETGLIIGSPSIAPGHRHAQQDVTAAEVIRMVGGTYRLASIAVEIGTDELARQTRRISDELRMRRRLWGRKRRPQSVRIEPRE
jgi:hypothetical protein